ncbi:phytanoyl-CoA dioxygenase family protein [Embleya sp. NPDC059237]|uniref:phytanoyl-CoA dioxygenase family protein n=1 Tax=Embleya sp. NPDC059237 TaxID=3346784 RepID=UPI0036B79781
MITNTTHEHTMRAGLRRFGYALLAGEIGRIWTERIREEAVGLFTPVAHDGRDAKLVRPARNVRSLSREIDILGDSVTVKTAVRRVLAADHVAIVTYELLRIPARDGEQAPIQDAVVEGFDADTHVCAYVALDSLYARHGAVMVYPQAHDRARTHRGDPAGIDPSALPASGARHIQLHPGDVLFVHGWLPHGWTNNAGGRDLLVVRILYRGVESRPVPKPDMESPITEAPRRRGDGLGPQARTIRVVAS